MNKLIRLFGLLAFLLLFPASANATCGGACFWIGGTGTLNLTSDSAHWATSSGGTTCSCEPVSTDTITFDGSSGGGVVTVNTGGTWTNAALTLTAFTGTLDFSVNNNSVTTTGAVDDNGTNTFKLGNGTWTVSGSFFRVASTVTFSANSSTIAFTGFGGVGSFKRLFPSGQTFNAVTIAGNTNSAFFFVGAGTIASLTVSAPNRVYFPNGQTVTTTTFNAATGSSGSEIYLSTDSLQGGAATISSANNFTCTWCGLTGATFTGGGTFTANNSFDLGANSGITINAPSAGGGGGGHVIGGI
jgi:hypothetical protein